MQLLTLQLCFYELIHSTKAQLLMSYLFNMLNRPFKNVLSFSSLCVVMDHCNMSHIAKQILRS